MPHPKALLYSLIVTLKMRGVPTNTKSHTYLFVLPQKLPILAEKTLLIISCGGELGKKKEEEMHFWIKKSISHLTSHKQQKEITLTVYNVSLTSSLCNS